MLQQNTVDPQEAGVSSSHLRRSLRLRNLSTTVASSVSSDSKNSLTDLQTSTKSVRTGRPCEAEELDTSKDKESTVHIKNEKSSETVLDQSQLDMLPEIKESKEVKPKKEIKCVCLKCGASNTDQKSDEDLQVVETENVSISQSEVKNQEQKNILTEQKANSGSSNASVKIEIGRLKKKLLLAMDHSNCQIQEKVMNKTEKKVSGDNTRLCETENITPHETASNSVRQNNFVSINSTGSVDNNNATVNLNCKETSSPELIGLLEERRGDKNSPIPNILSTEILEQNADNDTQHDFDDNKIGDLSENRTDKNSSDLSHEKSTPGSNNSSSRSKSTNIPTRRNMEVVGTDNMIKVCDDELHVRNIRNTNEKIEENLRAMVEIEKEDKRKNVDSTVVFENSFDSKIDKLLSNANISSSASDTEQNSFLDTMAEEGEEDTPSEGSNDIIEVGEEINTTESDLSSDQSYDKDSFIDDEENHQLLSGEEYDLSFEDDKRRKRIIDLSSGSDEEIIHMKRPIQKIEKKRKKSRIIRYEDSSEEDIITTNTNSEEIVKEDVIKSPKIDDITNIEDNVPEVCTIENDEVYTHVDLKSNEENYVGKSDSDQLDNEVTLNVDNISEFENEDHKSDGYITAKEVDKNEGNILCDNKKYEQTKIKNFTEDENTSRPNHINITTDSENRNKKIVILENIKVQDICNKNLSNHINCVINSLFSGIKKSNEVSLNLLLDCSSENLDESIPEVDQHTRMENQNDNDRVKSDVCITKQQIKKNDGKPKRNKKMRRKKKRMNVQETENNKSKILFPQSHIRKKSKKKKKSINNTLNVITELQHSEMRSYPDFKNDNKSRKEAEKQKTDESNDNFSTEHKSKKRKRSTSETSMVSGDGEKRTVKKHRNKKKLQLDVYEPENTKLSLLAEAILDNNKKKTNRLPYLELSDKKWEVANVDITPSQTSQTPNIKVEMKPLQITKSRNVLKNKFHQKDFRNLVLYDNTRVKRMDTQKLLKKSN